MRFSSRSTRSAMRTLPRKVQIAFRFGALGLIEKGDRKTCIRFGILIGRNEQRNADWRRAHADWFWFER